MKAIYLSLILICSTKCFSQNATISCEVYGGAISSFWWNLTQWGLDGAIQEYGACGDPYSFPSIHVAVVDKDSCKAWATCSEYPYFDFNQENGCGICRTRPEYYYIFRQYDANSMANLDSMLSDPILNGHHLLIYSMNMADFAFLNNAYPNTIQILQNLGFTGISSQSTTVPFIFYAEVGTPSSAVEVYGIDSLSFISLTQPIQNCGATSVIDEDIVDRSIYPTYLKNGEKLIVDFDKLEIYDISGKLMCKNAIAGNSMQINNFFPGIYFVRYSSSGKVCIGKIEVVD